MSSKTELRKSQAELAALLSQVKPPESLVPDLVAIVRDPQAARQRPSAETVLRIIQVYLPDIQNIPLTTYTLYREFQRAGERRGYQAPYNQKRCKLTAAAFQVLLGDDGYIDTLQDYIWNICEETNWVIPAHETREIDLGAVATGFALAEIIVGLEHKLADEIVRRVRAEIERRIFTPYLERHEGLNWFRGHNNWNGVCNSAVGAMFLLLEKDTERLAQALSLVLEGLEVFLETAFEADGGSTEGTGYWQYGLSNLIPFAEMLRLRTNGAIDILGLERMKAIATYPTRMMLSPGHYANFSDCEEEVAFNPANVARLAERTGVQALYEVLAEGAPLVRDTDFGRFHNLWRIIPWWDGTRPKAVTITDVWAKDVGAARLVAQALDGSAVVLAAKAGHNAENHNQNDVGSFILHVAGESLLCEPGRGLYSRDYFGPRRYENPFASSFGHSVPRIGGRLQSAGPEYRGEITAYDDRGPTKGVAMTIGEAYDVPGLEDARRVLSLDAASGTVVLEDTFCFAGDGLPVEEAFVTWCETSVAGPMARIQGERHVLEIEIQSPTGATFALQVLTKESEANAKPVPLKRLTFEVLPARETVARVQMRIR